MCGSGGNYSPYVPGQARAQIQNAKHQTEIAEYEQQIGEQLNSLLQEANKRDAGVINDRLTDIKNIIENYIDESISLRFGGSVSRNTYVAGLSDVDALILLDQDKFGTDNPQSLLQEFERLLRRSLPASVAIKRGDLAVTVTYKDQLELQLLPALKTQTGVRIASNVGQGWSNVIHPERLARRLTAVNQANGGRVVPLIKIVKTAVDQLPSGTKPRGHHIEALAIGAFEKYGGKTTLKAMLEHFFEDAAKRVRIPLKDQTEQSDYLDDYMGSKDSTTRRRLSAAFDKTHSGLKSANDDLSVPGWLGNLGM